MDIRRAFPVADLVPLKTEIPGLEGSLWYRPQTLGQSDKIQRYVLAERLEGDGAKLAVTLILSLLNKDGEQVLSMMDRAWLMYEVPQTVLLDIVTEITGPVAYDPIEDAEGN